MNRNEYIQQRAAIDEAAKEIALDLIHDQFPDVEWTPTGKCKLLQNGTLARLNPEYDENTPAAGGLFEVNFLTGSVLYVGADFSKMTAGPSSAGSPSWTITSALPPWPAACAGAENSTHFPPHLLPLTAVIKFYSILRRNPGGIENTTFL